MNEIPLGELNSFKFGRTQNRFIIYDEIYSYIFHVRSCRKKEYILEEFPFAPFRIDWNPVDRYFMTQEAAFSFRTKSFPIELFNKDLSYGSTLVNFLMMDLIFYYHHLKRVIM